jgi:5-methylcytosine rRNA methyltransferase NSUN4
MNIAVDGTVVYSTCSLSPIQNDGVVKMALKKIWEETNHQIIVKYIFFQSKIIIIYY